MARPKVFTTPATVEGISTLREGGFSIRFHTNEVKDERQQMKLMKFNGAFGWLQFSDQSIHSIPSEVAHREAGSKTPSQRLRASLFVLWQKRYSDTPFDPWYEQQMEKIIARVQGSIDD